MGYMSAEYFREYRKKNPEKIKEYNKRWAEKNLDKKKEYNKKWMRENYTSKRYDQIKLMVKSMISGSNKRGLICELSYGDVEEMIDPMLCSVTGVKLSWDWNDKGRNPWRPSIDRIDPSKGYVKDNVRVVCWAYNAAKNEWSDAVVQKWARNIQ